MDRVSQPRLDDDDNDAAHASNVYMRHETQTCEVDEADSSGSRKCYRLYPAQSQLRCRANIS